MVTTNDIDIKESTLRSLGVVLDTLIFDRTTRKNIIWATDSYEHLGKQFAPNMEINPDLVTGQYKLLIQPRAAKSREEQRHRTKVKAEVFTPLKTVEMMNRALEPYQPNNSNWQDYVYELKLEITCGEAPFIVTRYNPVAHGVLIKISSRVGFLDKKLKVVSKFCDNKVDWLVWAKEAFRASYGYEWQGDNVLLARENLLYTFIDYFEEKFEKRPNIKILEEIAEIISWNIFQMDGLRYVIPMSCHHESRNVPKVSTRFEEIIKKVEKHECEGCKYNRLQKHNGQYATVMDWRQRKTKRFVDLVI